MAQNAPPSDDPTPPAVTQTLAILEPWFHYVPRRQRRLGLFIFIAFLIHVVAFFYIRIDANHPELRRQDRVHVSVDFPQATAVSSVTATANIWDQLTDPRLFILPLHPLDAVRSEVPAPDLNANLSNGQLPDPAAPEGYHAATAAVTPLEQRVGEAMRPPRQPFHYDEPPPAIAQQTTWQVDPAFAARQPTALPALPSPVSDTDLSPTELRVAVDQNGTVQHALVEQGSGDLGATAAKDLDEQAVAAAKKIRFQPTDQPGVQWGRVTVFWRYTSKPREEVIPTPPTTQ